MSKLTAELLVAEVRRLATENPDAVYINITGTCSYLNGTAGCGSGCIIGQAILAIDPDLRDFLRQVDGVSISAISKRLGLSYGPEIRWLSRVQSKQDCGHTWGKAVKQADKEASYVS